MVDDQWSSISSAPVARSLPHRPTFFPSALRARSTGRGLGREPPILGRETVPQTWPRDPWGDKPKALRWVHEMGGYRYDFWVECSPEIYPWKGNTNVCDDVSFIKLIQPYQIRVCFEIISGFFGGESLTRRNSALKNGLLPLNTWSELEWMVEVLSWLRVLIYNSYIISA